MQSAEEHLEALTGCMDVEFGGGLDVDMPAALAIIEARDAAIKQATRAQMVAQLTENYAPRCRRCTARVELQRWCYAIPMCFACLPPPDPIETLHLPGCDHRVNSVGRCIKCNEHIVDPSPFCGSCKRTGNRCDHCNDQLVAACIKYNDEAQARRATLECGF